MHKKIKRKKFSKGISEKKYCYSWDFSVLFPSPGSNKCLNNLAMALRLPGKSHLKFFCSHLEDVGTHSCFIE